MAARGAAKSARGSRGGKAGGKNEVPPTRATGLESATGTALNEAARTDVPKGKERGSTVPIDGGQPKPDYLEEGNPNKISKEPAKFTSNGQVPDGTVGSPSGSVPVAAFARDQKHADQLLKDQAEKHNAYIEARNNPKKLDDNTVNRMGGAELRAIGLQRGYDLGERGTRGTRAEFIRAQDKDKTLKKA
jgi:hypothetical protein